MLQGIIFTIIALAFTSIIAFATDVPTLLSLFSGNTASPPVLKVDVYSFYIIVAISKMLVFIEYVLLGPGLYITALKQIRGRVVSVGDLFAGVKYSGGVALVLAANIVIIILCQYVDYRVGRNITGDPLFRFVIYQLLLCFGETLILAWMLMVMPALIDKRKGIVSAVRMSYGATIKRYWFFVAFILVLNLISRAGVMVGYFFPYALIITYIIFTPIPFIASVVAYERTFSGYGASSSPKMQRDEPLPPPYMPTPEVLSASDTVEKAESMSPVETNSETPPEA